MPEAEGKFWIPSVPSHHRAVVNMPRINTYVRQIEQCQAAYSRLELNKSYSLPPTPFPKLVQNGNRSAKSLSYSLRSATFTTFFCNDITESYRKLEEVPDAASHVSASDIDSMDLDMNKKKRLDPIQLSAYLKEKGYGIPSMSTNPHNTRNFTSSPIGIKARMLPKDPATREKIKGRARLDYEMANLKALAFCEQHTQRFFRTASADLRNQDVQFVEDQMREQWQLENNEIGNDVIASGYVAPINREELFVRIKTWIEDVDSAMSDEHPVN